MRVSLVAAAILLLAVMPGGGMQAGQQAARPASQQAGQQPAAQTPPYLWAEVAFSEVQAFDYDRDGKRDRVQFWFALEGRPVAGDEGSRVESGTVRYFVLDMDRKTRIKDWLMGFNMGFPAPEEPHPITNLSITGRTAQFDLRGATWTVTDAGDTWAKDTIEIKDSSGVRRPRFFGGDFRVVPDPAVVTEPLAIEANASCVECHREAAVAIAAKGGPHRELECASCHMEHPPEKEGARPQCSTCHQPHGPGITDASCGQCHLGHAPATSAIAATVPDASCAACHEGAASALRASGSLHMGVTCVTCHRKEHKATSACQFCHRASHPQHVMQKPGSCGSCHNTAHALKSARAQ